MGFSRDELEAARALTVPDLLGDRVDLLFVGINPGLWTAASQTHFAHPGNRFYPALRAASIIDRDIDRSAGMTDDDRDHVTGKGIGITNIVTRTTARASELTTAELREGGERLVRLVEDLAPAVVAVAGVTAYRTAFRQPKAHMGEQETTMGSARLWVVPNPSGLNAHETVETLAAAYREAADAAGIT